MAFHGLISWLFIGYFIELLGLLIVIVNCQSNLQKASGALKNSVQEMQKRGKSDTKVNGKGVQPVSSSAQITEITAVQDHTKV